MLHPRLPLLYVEQLIVHLRFLDSHFCLPLRPGPLEFVKVLENFLESVAHLIEGLAGLLEL
jgi:hypothetical protein